jgi:hypothetical protein
MAGSVFGNTIQSNIVKYASDLPPQYAFALINDASAVYTIIPEQYREQSLIAYTEALRSVYIIGVPLAAIGLVGALCIKNTRMQTKEQEEEANRLAMEKEAGGAATVGDADAEKAMVAEESRAEREEDIAVGTALTNAEPAGVVEQRTGVFAGQIEKRDAL